MKFFASSFIISFFCHLYMSWWICIPITLTCAYLFETQPKKSFWGGFLSISLVWILVASYESINSDAIITRRMTEFLHLPKPLYLFLITGIVGGISGGLGALCGTFFSKVFSNIIKIKQL